MNPTSFYVIKFFITSFRIEKIICQFVFPLKILIIKKTYFNMPNLSC